MACQTRLTALPRPPSVAVHDDGNVLRHSVFARFQILPSYGRPAGRPYSPIRSVVSRDGPTDRIPKRPPISATSRSTYARAFSGRSS